MKNTKTSVITLTLLLSLTLMPLTQAGAFSDWWNNLFTGNAIEETTKTSDSQTTGADVELAKTIEEQKYQEPTPILKPIGTPIDTKQKTLKTTDFINIFGQGITGTQKETFRQAIEQTTNTQRQLAQQIETTTNKEPTLEETTKTAQELANTFGRGIQGSKLEQELLQKQNTQTEDNKEEELREQTPKGFFGWLRNLLGIGNDEETTVGSSSSNQLNAPHTVCPYMIGDFGFRIGVGYGATQAEAAAEAIADCKEVRDNIRGGSRDGYRDGDRTRCEEAIVDDGYCILELGPEPNPEEINPECHLSVCWNDKRKDHYDGGEVCHYYYEDGKLVREKCEKDYWSPLSMKPWGCNTETYENNMAYTCKYVPEPESEEYRQDQEEQTLE